MDQEKKPREQQLDELRHARVEELLTDLSAPTYSWRAADGILKTPSRSMAWASAETVDAMTRSAETRRRNAEIRVEDAVVEWYRKHFGERFEDE